MTSFDERRARGAAARRRLPRSGHGSWRRPPGATDPIALLEEQASTRVPELVPIRYGRMQVSPFTFYRGAALIMASDLASQPHSWLTVQLCGDAHLTNFGVFGTAERNMVFDINDFDETHPGPFEWDLKRLVASFEVAGRHRGFSDADRHAIALTAARAYREHIRVAASGTVLDAWYDQLDVEEMLRWLRGEKRAKRARSKEVTQVENLIAKARTRDSMRGFTKLVEFDGSELKFRADPPLLVPIEDLADRATVDRQESIMRDLLRSYQATLTSPRHPLDEFTYLHMARKVVGVGSVGTRAWIVLLQGRDQNDPLLLQAKEAEASVLERFLGDSVYDSHGERVVRGQRLMQAAGDIFLGWQRVTGLDGQNRDFYVRQLHDWKGSVNVDRMAVPGARLYAQLCGEALARAHCRSGDRVAIAAYLGRSDTFDRAIAAFAKDYADQNDADFAAFEAAVGSGRLVAQPGL
ncbi:DUF2252 domain-containing protein [Microbacterium sp. cx-55]|uniref:DUF2252 domain-containing protein n=1 Tax=Microbacterium sp. cx-55 TaxID=2875948 RepID=UPI001CC11F89|nr:DUF2252 domain-containing protein [Microbacterium sp. cx-55]MBZ4486038.1 DUF2252 domain-containing protein [Microbacterium sp. cx-55]UGB34090.1 DUF2252 domain-containing protein [Microbacterium sp. cx-55]